MAHTYRVFFTSTASTVVEVEAEDFEAAVEAAYDGLPGGVCAQCAGWGGGPGIELAGEWDADYTGAVVDGEFVENPS